jgi:glycosyltransferase involved in cell wall biosynthesis
MPWVSLVLVGDATCSLARLAALPNVHCLGRRPYEEIPRYGAGFDVAIMPWLDNDWIRHCNPVKLKEYLALGLPVVSTQYPDVHRYSDVVDIATDADRFISLVAGALDGRATGTPATRRAAVAGDGWDVRAAELLAVCDEVTRRRARCVAS